MKDLWKKTKNKVVIGVAKLDAQITHKDIENEPEFVKRVSTLKEIDRNFGIIHRSCQDMNGFVKRIGDILFTMGDAVSKSIPDGANQRDVATKALTLGQNVKKFSENANNYYIPTAVLAPLNKEIEEVKRLKELKETTKLNLIQLRQEESKLKAAREKNKDTVPKLEEAVDKCKEKYDHSHDDFVNGVDCLSERVADICGETYKAALFYLQDIFKLTENEIETQIPSAAYSANHTLSSCSETPPHTHLTSTTT